MKILAYAFFLAVSLSAQIIGPGGGGGGGGTPGGSNNQLQVNSAGVFGAIPCNVTGAVVTGQNGALPACLSQGIGGRTDSATSGSPVLCDTATTTQDRGTIIEYTAATAISVTVPQAGSSGCGNNFTFGVMIEGTGTATFTPTTSTLTVCDGSVCSTSGQTSVVLPSGQIALFHSRDNVNYVVRKIRSYGGTVTYTANQTASLADDGKLVIMNCAGACTYTLPTTQPSSNWRADVVSMGATLATVALSGGDTWYSAATAPLLSKFRPITIASNSSVSADYVGSQGLIVQTAGTGFSITSNAQSTGFSNTPGGVRQTIATRNTSLGTTVLGASTGSNQVTVQIVSYDATAGASCTGNSTVQWVIKYVDQNANTVTLTPAGALHTITTNGGPTISGDTMSYQINLPANMNNATGITFTSTYTAGSGCVTNPSYGAILTVLIT